MANIKKSGKPVAQKNGPFIEGKNWLKGMKSIYSYTDIHKFIHDACRHGSKADRKFTIQALSDRAKMNRTFLANIIAGRKDPGVRNILNLAQAMNLSKAETRYFIALKEYASARDKHVERYFKEELVLLRGRDGGQIFK
jgi:uncharacterized protein (TIGR02147 family)